MNHELPRQPEQEPLPYYQASQFAPEQEVLSESVYLDIQNTVNQEGSLADLSVIRLSPTEPEIPWYVFVLGKRPRAEVEQSILQALQQGEMVELPDFVVRAFAERRAEQLKQGNYVERHYKHEAEGSQLEQEAQIYYLAAEFTLEQEALSEEAHRAIIREVRQAGLVAYRFLYGERSNIAILAWYVAVLGRKPSEEIIEKIKALLSQGVLTELDKEVVSALAADYAGQPVKSDGDLLFIPADTVQESRDTKFADVKFSRKRTKSSGKRRRPPGKHK